MELYLNGRLVGVKGSECPRRGAQKAWNDNFGKLITTNDLHLSWDVPYEPGELRAVGYHNGARIERIIHTTKAAARLQAQFDQKTLKIHEIAQIEISAEDEDGLFVPDAAPEIQCQVEGPAHLVGMDSGDLYDLTLYGKAVRKMSAGRLLAVIRADAPGKAVVTFRSPGLCDTTVCLDISARLRT